MEKKSCCVLCFTLVCKCLRKVGRFIFKGSLKLCIHLSKKLGNCEIFIGKHFAIVSIVMVNKKKKKVDYRLSREAHVCSTGNPNTPKRTSFDFDNTKSSLAINLFHNGNFLKALQPFNIIDDYKKLFRVDNLKTIYSLFHRKN